MSKRRADKFNYAIGRPWTHQEGTQTGAICFYTVHDSKIHFGTLREAKSLARSISEHEAIEYHVYRVIPWLDITGE